MTRSRDIELLPLDYEIKKTCWRNRRAQNQSTLQHDTITNSREEGANTKALHDYATPIVIDTIFGIGRPPILVNNFEIKPVII